MKIEHIDIEEYKALKDFRIDFLDTNLKPLDLVVLIGTNGSGKTTLFEYIVDTLKYEYSDLNGTIRLNIRDLDVGDITNEETINIQKHNSDTLINLYNEDGIFLASKIWKKVFYVHAERQKSDNLKNEIIKFVETVVFEEELSAKNAYQRLREKFNTIFDGLDINIKFSGIDRDKNVYFENSLGQKILLDELSIGEMEILNKVFYLFISGIRDSVILIDTPEQSFHPLWQNRLIKIYKNLAKIYNNQIILSTHSPQIVASTPNDNIRIFVKEKNHIKIKKVADFGFQANKILASFMGVNKLKDDI